jgi:tripartite-type tricarboxylate transporter receptor subunit TctC
MRLTRRALLYFGGSLAAAPALGADDWPARPIKIVVGTAAGGSPDIISRLLADKLAENLGQAFLVENNSQGGGAVAQQVVAKSAADGTTLIMLTAGYPPQMVLRQSTPFDPLDGFAFITLVCGYPMVYAVRSDSPITSFRDLLDRAKADPGRITYTINALGSIYHVLTKWIEMESGIAMTAIPYRGTAAAIGDVLAGRIDLMVDAATSAFPRIASGQLRVLALSSPERYALMPDAPIIAETLPKVAFMSWLGLATAAGTPHGIVERLNREVHRALTLPDVQQRLVEGGGVATPSTPDEMRQKVASDMARWRQVIDAGGIKVE